MAVCSRDGVATNAPVSQERVQGISSSRKRSKFKVQFLLNMYHFHTIIKSENHKSKPHQLGTVYTYVLTLLTFLSPCLKPMYGVRDPVSMHCRAALNQSREFQKEARQPRHRVKCAQPPTGRGAALPVQHRAGIRGSPQQQQGSALLHHWPEPKSAPGLLTLASMSHLLPSEPPGASCFPFYHLEGQCPLGDSDTPQQDSPVSFYFPPTAPSNPAPTSCPEKMTSPGEQ